MDPADAMAEVTARTLALPSFPLDERSPSGFRRMRTRVPDVRKAAARGYSFSSAPPEEQIAIWDYIWNRSEWYEVAHQALYQYQHRSLTKMEFDTIISWIERCDSWWHSDDLSKIYAQVVEDDPGWILPTYEVWNTAESPWKRRQSIVGLIEYARKRKRVLPFPELIRFVDPLLDDEDYYVQKGIGWTLREIYNVYPAEATEYIGAHAVDLSAQAFSSATAKMDRLVKDPMKARRRTARG